MRILVNHLTRMHGGHICVAGIDVESGRHVRPVPEHAGLACHFLARYGGPFDMARIVSLGKPRCIPKPPHIEDVAFVPAWARVERTVSAAEFWAVLDRSAATRLCDIFGSDLKKVGPFAYGTEVGRGRASLGFLRPAGPPELYLEAASPGKARIRIRFGDGAIQAEAGVTDLRLYQADHATPDAAIVRAANRWIETSRGVILSVGLTREFRSSDKHPYLHWLQVNNVHLPEDPTWALG